MILLRCACLGAALALLYDLFSALRIRLRWKKRATFAADSLFWLIALVSFLLFFLRCTDGRLRAYLALGMAAGAVVYRHTLSPGVLWVADRLLRGLGWLAGRTVRGLLWAFSFPRGQ